MTVVSIFASITRAANRKSLVSYQANHLSYYVTNPIFYTNARPRGDRVHSLILGNAINSYHTLWIGTSNTLLAAGLDERSIKVQKGAQKQRLKPHSIYLNGTVKYSSLNERVKYADTTVHPAKALTSKQIEILQANRMKQKHRDAFEKANLATYLTVCIDVGQTYRASHLLLSYCNSKTWKRSLNISHFNIVLKGLAKLRNVSRVQILRAQMLDKGIKPDIDSFAHVMLANVDSEPSKISEIMNKLLIEMKDLDIEPRDIFQTTYLKPEDRMSILNSIRTIDPGFVDNFHQEVDTYECKLLDGLKDVPARPYEFVRNIQLNQFESWAEEQRSVEAKASLKITSIALDTRPPKIRNSYSALWDKYSNIWTGVLHKTLGEQLEVLRRQCAAEPNKVHLYPYLCAVDKTFLVSSMLDEIEHNAFNDNYSFSTTTLHEALGRKIMIRYIRAKAFNDESQSERQKLYHNYLKNYCTDPSLMGTINSREYIQRCAKVTKNYAAYEDKYRVHEVWPRHIMASVGLFLYSIILKEIKFDPSSVRSQNLSIRKSHLAPIFYTAYFQIGNSLKVKEEFRSHPDFGKFVAKACSHYIKFDYRFLPSCSPPMPWLSPEFGGYLTSKSELVRADLSTQDFRPDQIVMYERRKLYPSLDSLNALGLCPWAVNKEILDLIIDLFRAGGDTTLKVPLVESKMLALAPKCDDENKTNFGREKRRFDQKCREMYSLWRDCLYRLSIANHFKNRLFWFPHNMDFRGRTYPMPPHFNHLGADLARSLLLFGKGEPLGESGLSWLKLHCINLGGTMKHSSIQERVKHADEIMLDILDSADNPWDGRGWWKKHDNPWQVLACCKEIAKAIRSKDVKTYVSHLPVHQDGSCNGLQHYAALGRDSTGAAAVNIVPSDRPQDVYSRICERVEAARSKQAAEGSKIAAQLEGHVKRKTIKQTVMTIVYGVTRYGARAQIAKQLIARNLPSEMVSEGASYLTKKTFDSIGQMFERSREIQNWLTESARRISIDHKLHVSWETPLGFPVTQPYTHEFSASTRKVISGKSNSIVKLRLFNSPYAPVNGSKQKTAFPPNYIHSLDSSHMMLTSLFCERAGMTFVSVHDCYWTHTSTAALMNKICREQFVALHSQPLLENLAESFKCRYAAAEAELMEKMARTSQRKRRARSNNPSEGNNADKLETHSDNCTCDTSEAEGLSLAGIDVCSQNEKQAIQNLRRNPFDNVPTKGDLDLKVVLKSRYFFS